MPVRTDLSVALTGCVTLLAIHLLRRTRTRTRQQTTSTETSTETSTSTSTSPSPSPSTSIPPHGNYHSKVNVEGKYQSELIVMGSGSSSGIPRPLCLMDPHSTCHVCKYSLHLPPHQNKNYRGNPSLCIRYAHVDGKYRHIEIDVGKTFREAVCRWFPRYGVSGLDAVLLTHEHADACLGLDDLRGLQHDNSSGYSLQCPLLPIYLNQHSMDSLSTRFNYLCHKITVVVERKVSQLGYHIIKSFEPFTFDNLTIHPVPLIHGEDYISFGFIFGVEPAAAAAHENSIVTSNTTTTTTSSSSPSSTMIAYFSDTSRIPDATYAYLDSLLLQSHRHHLDLLFLDALFVSRVHNTHMNLSQALDVVRKIRPKRTLLIGMSDEFDHDLINTQLAQLHDTEGIDVQLSYDGMRIPVHL